MMEMSTKPYCSESVAKYNPERKDGLQVYCKKNDYRTIQEGKSARSSEREVMVESISSTTEYSPWRTLAKQREAETCRSTEKMMEAKDSSRKLPREEKDRYSRTPYTEESQHRSQESRKQSSSSGGEKSARREHSESESFFRRDLVPYYSTSTKKHSEKKAKRIESEVSSSSFVLTPPRRAIPPPPRISFQSSHDDKSSSPLTHKERDRSSRPPSGNLNTYKKNESTHAKNYKDMTKQKYLKEKNTAKRQKKHERHDSAPHHSGGEKSINYEKIVEMQVREIRSNLEKMSKKVPETRERSTSRSVHSERRCKDDKGRREGHEKQGTAELTPFLPSSRCCSPPTRPTEITKYWSDADETEDESDSEKHMMHVNSVNIVLNYLKAHPEKYYRKGRKKIYSPKNDGNVKRKGSIQERLTFLAQRGSQGRGSVGKHDRKEHQSGRGRSLQSRYPANQQLADPYVEESESFAREHYDHQPRSLSPQNELSEVLELLASLTNKQYRSPSRFTEQYKRETSLFPSPDQLEHPYRPHSPPYFHETQGLRHSSSRSPPRHGEGRGRQFYSPHRNEELHLPWHKRRSLTRESCSPLRHGSDPLRNTQSPSLSGNRDEYLMSRGSHSPSRYRGDRVMNRGSQSPTWNSASPLKHRGSYSPSSYRGDSLRNRGSHSPSRYREDCVRNRETYSPSRYRDDSLRDRGSQSPSRYSGDSLRDRRLEEDELFKEREALSLSNKAFAPLMSERSPFQRSPELHLSHAQSTMPHFSHGLSQRDHIGSPSHSLSSNSIIGTNTSAIVACKGTAAHGGLRDPQQPDHVINNPQIITLDDEPTVDEPERHFRHQSAVSIYHQPASVPNANDRQLPSGFTEPSESLATQEILPGPSGVPSVTSSERKDLDDPPYWLSDSDHDPDSEDFNRCLSEVTSLIAHHEAATSDKTPSKTASPAIVPIEQKALTTQNAGQEEKESLTLNSAEMSTLLSLIEVAKEHTATGDDDLSTNLHRILEKIRHGTKTSKNVSESSGSQSAGDKKQKSTVSQVSGGGKDSAKDPGNSRGITSKGSITNDKKSNTSKKGDKGVAPSPSKEKKHAPKDKVSKCNTIKKGLETKDSHKSQQSKSKLQVGKANDRPSGGEKLSGTKETSKPQGSRTKLPVGKANDKPSGGEKLSGTKETSKPQGSRSKLPVGKANDKPSGGEKLSGTKDKSTPQGSKSKHQVVKANDKPSGDKKTQVQSKAKKASDIQLNVKDNKEQQLKNTGDMKGTQHEKTSKSKDHSNGERKTNTSSAMENTFANMQNVRIYVRDLSASKVSVAQNMKGKPYKVKTMTSLDSLQQPLLKQMGKRLLVKDSSESPEAKKAKDAPPAPDSSPNYVHPLHRETIVLDRSVNICLACKYKLVPDEYTSISLSKGSVTMRCRICRTFTKMEKVMPLDSFTKTSNLQTPTLQKKSIETPETSKKIASPASTKGIDKLPKAVSSKAAAKNTPVPKASQSIKGKECKKQKKENETIGSIIEDTGSKSKEVPHTSFDTIDPRLTVFPWSSSRKRTIIHENLKLFDGSSESDEEYASKQQQERLAKRRRIINSPSSSDSSDNDTSG